jgi:hypothetical protein
MSRSNNSDRILCAMTTADIRWPPGLDPYTICFSVDVEWAAREVLADLVQVFDQFGVRATFFVTHAGVEIPGHERGLHPNFRRNGDTYRQLIASRGNDPMLGEDEIYDHIVQTTLAFAPEAKGLRSHSLYYDSALLPVYNRLGLEYDCSYQMPFVENLRPFWKHHDIVEIPTFYADHLDIMTGASGFRVASLMLDRSGIKVLDFHPNIIFLNASSNEAYMSTRGIYRDHERLLAARESGKGARTLLLELLETVAKKRLPTATLGEVNAAWREVARWT